MNLIGYYDWHSRELPNRGAALIDSEVVTVTISIIGGSVPRSITLQGVYHMVNAQAKGGVSAISDGIPPEIASGKWSWTGPRDDATLTLDF